MKLSTRKFAAIVIISEMTNKKKKKARYLRFPILLHCQWFPHLPVSQYKFLDTFLSYVLYKVYIVITGIKYTRRMAKG